MTNMDVEICRLCLKLINDRNYEEMHAISRNMLDVLLLKVDLDTSKKPMMCNGCATILRKCFNFKSACVIKCRKNANLNFETAYLKQENVELSGVSGDQKTCYFCWTQSELSLLKTLNESKENMFLLDVIQRHIPEMNTRITWEILTCETCIDSIQNLSRFVISCLDVEEKITKYIEMEGDDIIDLNKLSQFACPIIKFDINYDDLSKLKESSSDSKEGVTLKTEIKTEYVDINNTEFNNDEYLMKAPQQGDCERHGNVDLTSLPCPDKEEYQDEQHIIDHMLIQEEKEMYHCELCPYKGRLKRHLRSHMLSHKNSSEVKMHRCSTCGFQSRYKNVVNKHALVHKNPSEIIMYKCEKCPYEVRRKDSLKVHMVIHRTASEITIHRCNICGKGVKHKNSLSKHMLTHKDPSEIVMYKCSVCVYQTKYKNDLKKHIKTVHHGLGLEIFRQL